MATSKGSPTVASPALEASAIVSKLAAKDTRPWYQKQNLRILYLLMIPGLLGVEYTSGFDSSMMNGIQTITYWEVLFVTSWYLWSLLISECRIEK